jgi:hypothetical protein
MQNMRIRFGTARTRAGTSAVFPAVGKVTGMSNWITPAGTNLVLYQDGSNIKSYNQATATAATLVTGVTSRAPSFAPLFVWDYFCGFDSSSNGAFQCRIFDGTNVDKAFRYPPLITAWTAVDGGSGQCTQGQHFIGFVYQNRTGYSGIPITGINYAITATTNVSFAVTATSNASPDVLTVPGHTFVNGQTVTGAGATGDTAINGVFLVTNVVAGTSLHLTDLLGNPINGNGVYTGGGTLTAPDLVTAPGNNLQVGQQVTIAGATGDTAINGIRIVATTPTPGSTFTLTDTAGNIINSSGVYVSGGVVTNPIQFTTLAGNRSINISVTLPALTDGGTSANGGVQATLFLIATTASNPNIWYFLPTDFQTGEIGEQSVPYNTPVTLNFVMSLADFDMEDSLAGDTAQANFLLLSQDVNGNGPFNPSFVVAYGQRMCYGAGTILYVSDIAKPQQISADTNQVIMPNQRQIGAAFPLPGNTSLFITGDRWTAYVTDNSDSPSTWAEPITVSDMFGAAYPNLVCAATGGPWVWIVTEGGPYLFDGAYEGQPLTYLVSGLDETQNPIGWSRVNWDAAYAIKIVDDVQNFKVYIGVPLDGATECNYMFCIDYRMGKTFDTCDISLDVYTPQLFGSIAIVKEYATGLSNLWIGPDSAGEVVHLDPTTHNDQGAAIDNYWTSGLARGPNIVSSMVRVGSMDIWATGNAPLVNGVPSYLITLFGPDGQVSVPITLLTTQGVPAALTETPGLTYMSKFDISKIDNYYVRFRTNSVDAWQELRAFTCYEKEDLFNR